MLICKGIGGGCGGWDVGRQSYKSVDDNVVKRAVRSPPQALHTHHELRVVRGQAVKARLRAGLDRPLGELTVQGDRGHALLGLLLLLLLLLFPQAPVKSNLRAAYGACSVMSMATPSGRKRTRDGESRASCVYSGMTTRGCMHQTRDAPKAAGACCRVEEVGSGGANVGKSVGAEVGIVVGLPLGAFVGTVVGAAVGPHVGQN
jgi:hypothetical protein